MQHYGKSAFFLPTFCTGLPNSVRHFLLDEWATCPDWRSTSPGASATEPAGKRPSVALRPFHHRVSRMTQPGTALITGAAVRIGRALALDLAAQGWAVGLHCRRSSSLAAELAAELEEKIRASGGKAAVLPADLTDAAAPGHLLDACVSALGAPTLLINNAAMFVGDEVATLDPALWDAQLAVNLRAPVFLAKAFAAQLPAGASGNVINIIDQRVWKPTPRYFSYTASKAGPVGRNAHAGPGARPAHPRQRHRARPRAAQLAPDGGGVPGPVRGHHPRPRHDARGDRRRPSASSLTPRP